MGGKYYISVDCEGAACVVGTPGETGLGRGDAWRYACRQASLEASAAAKALFDAGAERVIVWDSHGAGVNLEYDLMDPRCEILLGAGHRGRFVGLEPDFAGVLLIGYHAMAGSEGVLSHTYSSKAFRRYKLDGRPMGELAVDAAVAGEAGVPVLFCSGDDVLLREARELLGDVAAVETKKALSRTSALSRHPAAVCQEIYDTVLAAAREGARVPIFTLPKPLEVELIFQNALEAAMWSVPDRRGRPFESPDELTRRGEVESVRSLFNTALL